MRASSGTITGGAIPPSPRFSFGLSSRGRVARRTWEERASLVTYSAKGGQRIKSGPRHLSLLLWDAVPCQCRIRNNVSPALVLQLMKNNFEGMFTWMAMNMFIPVFWCNAWGKWLIQRCALLSPAAQIFLQSFDILGLFTCFCLGFFFIPPSFANKSLYRGSWSKKKERSNVYNNHHAPSALISRIELALVLY